MALTQLLWQCPKLVSLDLGNSFQRSLDYSLAKQGNKDSVSVYKEYCTT